jgi:hypothetical protein
MVFAFLSVALLLPAADSAWRSKPVSEWTQEDASRVLMNSPWAKNVATMILHQQSEFERRDGGNMAKPTGVGYDGVGDPESKFQSRRGNEAPTLLLRWETAMPVRAAGLKAHAIEPPMLNADAYVLAVYGLPGGYFKGEPEKLGKPLRSQAVLRRDGKPDVKPSRVEVFQGSDGPMVVYEFPRTLEITRDDKVFYFRAVIGRLSLTQAFDIEAMQFQGKLEF